MYVFIFCNFWYNFKFNKSEEVIGKKENKFKILINKSNIKLISINNILYF